MAANKNTLHLTLKKVWFDMILSGEKTEEYREIKDYWIGRFVLDNERNTSVTNFKYYGNRDMMRNYYVRHGYLGGYRYQTILDMINISETSHFKKYDTVTFSLGYAKDRKQFEIELKSIDISTGNTDWGAEKDEQYFTLKLGNILNKNF